MIKILLCAVLTAGLASPLLADEPSPADKATTPDATARRSEYWLGVECRPLDDSVRRRFHLPDAAEGLLVVRVWTRSPAGEAGIEIGDVIVEAGGKATKEVGDLIAQVEAVKEKPLAIRIKREGSEQSLEVTPTKRPQPSEGPAEAETQRAMKWLDRFRHEMGESGETPSFRWHAIGPGVILRHDKIVRRALPDDVSVSIQKSGDKPAEITVRRGDKTWTTTEDALDKLPDEVRPFAEGMLGRNVMPLGPSWPPRVEGGVMPPLERPPTFGDDIEKRLEEMNRHLEKLDRAIEELRQPKPSAKEPPEGPVIEPARESL